MQCGQIFNSFYEFNKILQQYERDNRQKFVIKGSRTIEAAQKMLKRELNKDLKYYEVQFICIHGGTVRTRGKGLRKTRTHKMNCPALIKIRVTKSGESLQIKQLLEKHENHDMTGDRKSTTTFQSCQSVTSTRSIDSNIGQNNFEFVGKVENTTAEKLLSIKEESELYCRICLCVTRESYSYINIFPSYGENSCRQDKIQEMIRQIMPDLDLSLTYNPGICTDCENRLISAYDFVSRSIRNQKKIIDYKCKYGDNIYVNIQDVVKTCHNTLNKRPLTDLTDVPSKKLKILSPSDDQLQIKYDVSDIQHPDITIKEELACENSNDFIESTEVINNEAIIEQSCNRLLTRSADKDNYCNLKYINVSVPSLKQTTTSLSEKSGEEKNTSVEVKTYNKKWAKLKFIKPVNIIYGNTSDLNNTKFEGTKMNTIQTNKSDTSKS